MKSTRRTFLGASGSALGLAAASGLGALTLGSRSALAASGDSALSVGAIFFFLFGGARTQAMFNGRVQLGANPYQVITEDLLTAQALPIELPRLTMEGTGLDRFATNEYLNLVATAQHHNRTGSHPTGQSVACTGYSEAENKPGILALINALFSFRTIPCVNIGNDNPTTNVGSELPSTFVPIKIGSATNIADILESFTSTQVSEAEQKRIETLRYAIEDDFHRQTKYAEPEAIPFFQRKAAEVVGQLSDAALDITKDEATYDVYATPVPNTDINAGDPVHNGTLRTMFGADDDDLGEKAMLALRLRQFGCAGITLSSDRNFDTHTDEEGRLVPAAQGVGRALAALIDNMANIADPNVDGATLLDTTVITVLTDFGRGNWDLGSGFNERGGSDHRNGTDKTSFQCIPIVGGGLMGNRVLGAIGADGSPVGSSAVFTTQQILATVLDLMGVPYQGFYPNVESLVAQLA